MSPATAPSGAVFFMFRKRLLFDVCVGIAEPFRRLSSKATDYMPAPGF
jgi:hypothetical protein